MGSATREIALAIGVGDAKPLPYLSGAVNGARAFHDWASKFGYDSRLITDEDEPVTMDHLRAALATMLKPDDQPIHRMLLYFAGHGLIREAEEGLWLLSDWHDELRAVAIESLKRRLFMHDIRQIAIFSDSCRSLPPDVQAADLTPDAVLGRGPFRSDAPPAIDKFVAAQDGAETFMIPGDTPEEDRCLFSGLLIEGLWGTKPDAFSKVLTGKITSRSLGAFLQTAVPVLAKQYKRALTPSVSPTFSEDDDVYYTASRVAAVPAFPPWPTAEAVAAMGLRRETLKIVPGVGEEPLPAEPFFAEERTPLIETIRSYSWPRDEIFEGFAVEGAEVKAFWTPEGVSLERYQHNHWWAFRNKGTTILPHSVPVLIEFADGMFAAVAGLATFVGNVLRDRQGFSSLVYRRRGGLVETAAVAEEAIGQLEEGGLRADSATNLAVRLRGEKHADPVLGVISAYLYDAIDDIDSIRRMAYYYTAHDQPIPYDIVLLAQLRGEFRDGRFHVNVPAVMKRAPRTEHELPNDWTFSATPAVAGEVGGLWPWMRQGWTFLDDPLDSESTLIVPGLVDLIPFLRTGRFAMFGTEGGQRLAQRFGLSVVDQP